METGFHLTTCSNVGTEGGGDQNGTLLQRQATELGDQQEVKGCSGQLLSGAEQQRQLLHEVARYQENKRWTERRTTWLMDMLPVREGQNMCSFSLISPHKLTQ